MSISTEIEAEKLLSEEPDYAALLSKNTEPIPFVLHTSKPFFDTIKNLMRKDFNKGVIQNIESEVSTGFAHIQHYYPSFKYPKIHGIFTGFAQGFDLQVSEGDVFIGLDYFLDFKPPLQEMPMYLFQYYQPQNIAPKLMYLYSNKYMRVNKKDESVLNDMIAWGKTYYFTKQMLPCASDSLILERTQAELVLMDTYISKIWKYFVGNQLFYKEDRETKRKFLEPRPNCIEIADKCPGMVARWLGYKIVMAYMESHSELSLDDLMTEQDAQKIFKDSGFKPKIN